MQCPNCKIDLLVPSARYEKRFLCKNCKSHILSKFDFIVLDDGNEWDLYEFELLNDTNEKLDFLIPY